MKKNFKIILAAMLFFQLAFMQIQNRILQTEQFFTVSAGHLKQ